MANWESIQTWAFILLPILIPRLLKLYRWARSSLAPSSRTKQPIRAPSPTTTWALRLLFFSATIAFLSNLPIFTPKNIFLETHSGLQTTSTSVLFTRLAALRPLTPDDEKLRRLFGDATANTASVTRLTKVGDLFTPRYIYAHYGPAAALADCPLASPRDSDAPLWFFLYTLPALLAPHILHILVLGLATSSPLLSINPQITPTITRAAPGAPPPTPPKAKDPARSRWRQLATTLAVLIALVDIYIALTSDSTLLASLLQPSNQTPLPTGEFTFWHRRVYRGIAIAVLDALLGWMIWLQATNRAFQSAPVPPTPDVALHMHNVHLTTMLARLRGLSVLRNGVARSENLRIVADEYWRREDEEMRAVMEDKEVVEAVREALKPGGNGDGKARVDLERVERDAREFVERMILGSGLVAGGAR